MAHSSVEERLSALEREVAELRARAGNGSAAPPASPLPNWLDAIVGSMSDCPEFDEVARLGQAARRADRPPDKEPA